SRLVSRSFFRGVVEYQSRASRLGATPKRVETSPGAPTSLVRCRHAGKLEYAQGPCRRHALRRDRSGRASHRAIAEGLMNFSECGRSLRSKRRGVIDQSSKESPHSE